MLARTLLCLGLISTGFAAALPNCPPQETHTYGLGPSTGARAVVATGVHELRAGVVTVFDGNMLDCDGDGVPGEFDGDYEGGIGGAFFGHGYWADEPLCDYDLNRHGAYFTISDGAHDVHFAVGADDTGGPVVHEDPATGETSCSTDGRIAPCDPGAGCGPTDDPDDCLTVAASGGDTGGQGVACGAGGDGGYWVFLYGVHASEDRGGVGAGNPATWGTITTHGGAAPADLKPRYDKAREGPMLDVDRERRSGRDVDPGSRVSF